MKEIKFLKWLSEKTATQWWHDSADLEELRISMENGAVGVTTNPFLVRTSLYANPALWDPLLKDIPRDIKGGEKAEAIAEKITKKVAGQMYPVFEKSGGDKGFVCAQVNPTKPGAAKEMIAMAKRLTKWAPNIAVKLPVSNAGLEALEECAAEGITIVATVSFTVPQVIAVAERYRKGLARAKKNGIKPGKCYAVIMVGRLDDYIRDLAMDSNSKVTESDIRMAGTAAAKKAYTIFKEMKYEAIIMPAGMRGEYHAADLADAEMVLSVHPKIQDMIANMKEPFEQKIYVPVSKDVIDRLKTIPEFVRAYEPEGMKPEEFLSYGVTQKTLSTFVESWTMLESYPLK
jgi:transaldolase